LTGLDKVYCMDACAQSVAPYAKQQATVHCLCNRRENVSQARDTMAVVAAAPWRRPCVQTILRQYSTAAIERRKVAICLGIS